MKQADRIAALEAQVSALMAATQPVAAVCIESGYMDRGHYYEGRKKIIEPLRSIQHLPLGTKLYAESSVCLSRLFLVESK